MILEKLKIGAAAVSVAVAMAGAAAASVIDYEGTYEATSVKTGSQWHTVWLPHLFGNNGNTEKYWQFDGGAGFFQVGAGNSTARLTGNIVNNNNASYTMYLDASYTLRNGNAPDNEPGPGGPKKGGIKAPLTDAIVDTWSFFDISSATLKGTGDLEGLTLTLSAFPAGDLHPFQLGLGANDKDNGLGASGWKSWIVSTTDDYTGPMAYSSGVGPAYNHGDINIRLTKMPIPAAGLMLLAGLGGLGALRLRKKA